MLHGVIGPDPERLKPLMKLQFPTCKSALQRLVGMFAYYTRWIPQFSGRIRPRNLAITCNDFPLSKESAEAFESLKETFLNCSWSYIRDDVPFQVDCDASEHSVAVTLSQEGRSCAFFSKTLNKSEKVYLVVEKEALAAMETVRQWIHYLYGKCFDLVTDRQALLFILDKMSNGKGKNQKIQLWRADVDCFDYYIHHRPGKLKLVLDFLLCVQVAASTYPCDLEDIHKKLGHPGIIRFGYFVRTKNLPFSVDHVKRVCSHCKICAKIKPRFCIKEEELFIKSTRPLTSRNLYLIQLHIFLL